MSSAKPITAAELAELERVADAADTGPWGNRIDSTCVWISGSRYLARLDQHMQHEANTPVNDKIADHGKHIAAFDPPTVKRLLDSVRTANTETDVVLGKLDAAEARIRDLEKGSVDAIDYTRQYVGEQVLPCVKGWTWWDFVVSVMGEEAARERFNDRIRESMEDREGYDS